MSTPFFSIIIATYNRGHLIGKTIRSVLNQSLSDYELIIIDDGSTDNTRYVVSSYNNKKLRYVHTQNQERGAARNKGIELSKGKYITFLDSDDLLYPDYLSHAQSCIKEDTYFLHTGYEIKESGGKRTFVSSEKIKNLNRYILSGNHISCIGIFISKTVFEQVLFCSDRRLAGSEDWLLWLQISARFKMNYSPHITSCMVQHQGRSVLNYSSKELFTRAKLLIHYLTKDQIFVKKYKIRTFKKIEAHMLSYAALHLAISNSRKLSVFALKRSVTINPLEIFTRRFWVILLKVSV